jgi:hypothetical protein
MANWDLILVSSNTRKVMPLRSMAYLQMTFMESISLISITPLFDMARVTVAGFWHFFQDVYHYDINMKDFV